MITIGLSGGIAAGKSSVSSIVSELGAVLINADTLGHVAYQPGTACLSELVAHFGQRIVNSADGTVNRKELGSIVFADPKEMKKLNQIVWPAIRSLIVAKLGELRAKAEPPQVVVVEAAILLEAEWDNLFDEVWVVAVAPEEAVERLRKRNNLTAEQAKQRLDAQLDNDARVARAQITLWNDGTMEQIKAKAELEYKRLVKDYYKGLSSFELVDVVDRATNQVAKTVKRAYIRRFNACHRATYIVVSSRTGQYYVQKRTMLKDYCPGMLDASPGGVLTTGEDPKESAVREMAEEMGITNAELVSHGTFHYASSNVDVWGYLFSCVIDTPVNQLKLQEEEVESVALMTSDEVLARKADMMEDGFFAFERFLEAKSTNKL